MKKLLLTIFIGCLNYISISQPGDNFIRQKGHSLFFNSYDIDEAYIHHYNGQSCDSMNRILKQFSTSKDTVKLIKNGEFYYGIFYDDYKSIGRNKEEAAILWEAIQYKNIYRIKKEQLDDSIKSYKGKALFDSSLDKSTLLTMDAKIDKIKKEHSELLSELYHRALFRFSDYRMNSGFLWGRIPGRWFPTVTKYDASIRSKYLFENNFSAVRFLSEAHLSIPSGTSNDKVMSYIETYKDYLGYFKVSIGAMLHQSGSISKDSNGVSVIDSTESKSDAIARIMGGGGNLTGNVTLPIYYFKSKNNQARIFLAFQAVPTLDIPGLGTVKGDINFATHGGIEASAYYNGFDGNIALFITGKLNHVIGSSKYYDYLNIAENSYIRTDGMMLNSFKVGVVLASMFRISYSVFGGDRYVRENFGSSIQVSFSPSIDLIKK